MWYHILVISYYNIAIEYEHLISYGEADKNYQQALNAIEQSKKSHVLYNKIISYKKLCLEKQAN